MNSLGIFMDLQSVWRGKKYESLWNGVVAFFYDLRYGDQMPTSQITNTFFVFVGHKHKLRYETTHCSNNNNPPHSPNFVALILGNCTTERAEI